MQAPSTVSPSHARPSLWCHCRSDSAPDPGDPGGEGNQRGKSRRPVPYFAQRGLQARESPGAGRPGRAHRPRTGAPAPPQPGTVTRGVDVAGALPHILGAPAGGPGGVSPSKGAGSRVGAGPSTRGGWAMKTVDETTPVLVVRRQLAVPRERVFEAWLDSESLAQWMRPTGTTHASVTVDPRVGGGFRIVMEGAPHGCVEHTGEYLAIEPPSRLSFTWISKHTDHRPTVVTIEFHERGT